MEIFEQIVIRNILKALNDFPTKVEAIDKEVKLQDLISNDIFNNKYMDYLKKNSLEQIVNLFNEIYGNLKNTMNKLSKNLSDIDIKF